MFLRIGTFLKKLMENDTIKIAYQIPRSKNARIFGPPTWFALHDLVSNIPCSDCKNEAISFMRFFHDMKNYELGKQIRYKSNFVYWINKISKLKNKPLLMK